MNIYAGNLPFGTTGEELLREFKVFGTVVRVKIINERYAGSGRHRSHGYVEMASSLDGQTAINALEGKSLKGCVMTLVEALPISEKRNL